MRRIDSRVSYKQGYPGASVPAELGCVVGGRRRVNKYVVCARACARGRPSRRCAGASETAVCVYSDSAGSAPLFCEKIYRTPHHHTLAAPVPRTAPRTGRARSWLVSSLHRAHPAPQPVSCVTARPTVHFRAPRPAGPGACARSRHSVAPHRLRDLPCPLQRCCSTNAPLSVLRSASSLRLPRGRPPSAFNRHVAFRCLMLMPRFRSWACPRSLGAVLSRVASQAHGAAAASAEHPAHKISTARSGPRPPLALGWRGRARRQPGHLPSGSASGYASMKPNVWIMSSRPKR